MEALTRIRDEFDGDGRKLWDVLPEPLQQQFAEVWKPVEFELSPQGVGHWRLKCCDRCGAAVPKFAVSRHARWHANLSLRVWVMSAAANGTNENMAKLGDALAEALEELAEEEG